MSGVYHHEIHSKYLDGKQTMLSQRKTNIAISMGYFTNTHSLLFKKNSAKNLPFDASVLLYTNMYFYTFIKL